eukprot:CAMPEP_0198544196 /NCGR_PEP_ID=MMETSP1462-20131121/60075_1 /TAXON_ID=1333877 /ORGANISM="Brandtodinium nutriculum, Strain RCC3387" /LENGTH=64 /DNA_ID=CAMNT_0044274509 /DNA_START=755 /DNA_END=949 /DNA_ORIENTATION=+
MITIISLPTRASASLAWRIGSMGQIMVLESIILSGGDRGRSWIRIKGNDHVDLLLLTNEGLKQT